MSRSKRLPRQVERELGKFLSTIGFSDYGSFFWDKSETVDPNEAVSLPRLSDTTEAEILGQVRHDPSVLPLGRASLSTVRRRVRHLTKLYGISSFDLFDVGDGRPDVVIVASIQNDKDWDELSRVAENAAADGARLLIVIAHQTSKDASATAREITSKHRVVFWRDPYWNDGRTAARLFAMYVHSLGPTTLISLQCQLGVETLGYYGRALTTFCRLVLVLGPSPDERALAEDVYHLRLAAPNATLVVDSPAQNDVVRFLTEGIEGPGTIVIPRDGASSDSLRSVLGPISEDKRSTAAQRVTSTLRGRTAGSAQHPVWSHAPHQIDVTATILFHRERELAVPALRSLTEMVDVARAAGLRVEVRALLDNADSVTRDLVHRFGRIIDDIVETSVADPAQVRNAGTDLARGTFLAFFDGDDLWGANWLRLAFEAAVSAPETTVWHPEAFLFFHASDCVLRQAEQKEREKAKTELYVQQSSTAPDFEPRDLLLGNLWTVNAFAPTTLYKRFPYRANDWKRQIGVEDWAWNLETLGHNVPHLIVPDTVHLIRRKDEGSLGQHHDSKGLLPLLN